MVGASHNGTADILLAPVTITPTKPLTPTHVKGVLWLDVIYRATRLVAVTDYVWNPRTANLTAQTAAFWAFLDDTEPGTDWSACSEAEIGALYVRAHAEGFRPARDRLRAYLDRVDADGWIHPASRRLLALWQEQFRLLGVADPGLLTDRAMEITAEDTIDLLTEHGMLVDHRRFGGPAYIDGPRWGQPLRQLVGADGHVNYLLPILRDLVPRIARRERVVLVHDAELTQDYVLLDRILTTLGVAVSRLALGRVAIAGLVQSSRHGGWQGITLERLARGCLEHVDLPTYRLGMRLYFVGVLKRAGSESFDPDLLRRCLERAGRILRFVESDEPCEPFLKDLTRTRGYVDAHRLTTLLLTRKRAVPVAQLVQEIYR